MNAKMNNIIAVYVIKFFNKLYNSHFLKTQVYVEMISDQ